MLPSQPKLSRMSKTWPQAFLAVTAAILRIFVIALVPLMGLVMLVGGPVARAQTVPGVNYEGENVMAIDLASRPPR